MVGNPHLGLSLSTLRIEEVEPPCDLSCDLHVRNLILADGNVGGLIHQDVGSHEHGIAEESVGVEILLLEILLLLLVGRDAFEPAQRGHHGEQQVEFGVLRHMRLDEDGRLLGIESGGEPVESHFKDVGLDPRGISVIGGESMPVGDKEKAIVFVLEPGPVLQRSDVVANVQFTCRSHAAEYAAVHSLFDFCRHLYLSRGILRKSGGPERSKPSGRRHNPTYRQKSSAPCPKPRY